MTDIRRQKSFARRRRLASCALLGRRGVRQFPSEKDIDRRDADQRDRTETLDGSCVLVKNSNTSNNFL
jgi:hypothetical protein